MLLILFVVDLFLWLLTLVPVPALEPYGRASGLLAWIAVILLALLTHAIAFH